MHQHCIDYGNIKPRVVEQPSHWRVVITRGLAEPEEASGPDQEPDQPLFVETRRNYDGEWKDQKKINEAQGRLLTTNRIYNDGSGTVDIGKAMEGFLTFLPPQMKIEKPVVHISLNPHPEDVLTDIELQHIAREYLEKLGFGNQPYLVFKHEDIDRHHLHIVTVNVDENGKRLNRDFLYRRSDRIRRELEQKYGLHPAERKNQRLDNPLRKVAASAGDVKKQVGNTVKALNGQYRFQTMGEYRALLSLYNMTVEEARGQRARTGVSRAGLFRHGRQG